MDVRMPDMDGVQCTKFVKEVYPEIKVIVLTTFDDDEYIFSALKYGASGYLLKGVSLDEMCIRDRCATYTFIHRQATRSKKNRSFILMPMGMRLVLLSRPYVRMGCCAFYP